MDNFEIGLLDRVRARLRRMDTGELKRFAPLCGVSWQTLYTIGTGRNTNPKIGTLEAVDKAMREAVVKPVN